VNAPSESGIARGALAVAAGSAAAAAAAFAGRLVMARALSPADLGVLTLAIAIVSSLGGIAALGSNASAAQSVASWRARGDPARARDAARAALALAGAAGAIAALALAGTAAAGIATKGELARILVRLAPAVTAVAVGTAVLGISRGWGDVAGRAWVRDTGGGLLRLAGVLWGAARGAPQVALGWAAGTVASESLFFLWARRRHFWTRRHAGLPGLREQRPFAFLSVLLQAAQWSDVLLLGALAPSAAVGLYGVARGVGRVLEIAAESAGHRFLPAASGRAAQSGALAIGPLYRRTRGLVAVLVWPVAAPFLLFTEPLLGDLFGSAYAPAAAPLRLLVAGLLLSVVCGYNDKALLALERASLVWRGLAAGVLAGGLVTLVLAPRLGAVGAAWGYLVMQAVQNSVWSWHTWRAGVAMWNGLPTLLLLSGLPVAIARLSLAVAGTDGLVAVGAIGLAAAAGALALLKREVWRTPASGAGQLA
jgi:O-antigen/teichoic acid export membrane protein